MLENPFLYSLAVTLVHFIWQGCLVALFLKVALTFISSKKPQTRYALATVAMLVNLLLPLATFLFVYQVDFERLSNSHEIIGTLIKNIGAGNEGDFSASIIEYLPFISLAWLVSICYLTIKLFFDIHFVNYLTKVDVFTAEPPLATRFVQLAEQMQLHKMPKLLISLKAEIPMAVGWLKPVVLLPVTMISGLSAAQLEMLLLHELAHIKRHDYIVNFLQTIIEILLFFHPAVHWVSTQMRNEREFCSDDIAVHHCCKPIAYARTLTETAALCQKNSNHSGHSIPQMALAASGGDLKQRVIRLVDSHCTSNNDLGKWFAGVFLFLSLLIISSKQILNVPAMEDNFAYLPFYSNPKMAPTLLGINNTGIDLSQTPIAQQLLNNRNKVPLGIEKNITAELKEVNKVALFNKSDNTNTAPIIAKKQPQIIEKPKAQAQVNNITVKTLALVDQKQQEPVSSNITKIKLNNLVPLAKTKPKAKTVKAAQLKSVQKPSLLNGIATHSNDVLEQFKSPKNPYAGQIAELSQPVINKIKTKKMENLATEHQAFVNKSARVISAYSPKYPTIAKRKKLELEILVHFNIDTNGFVSNIEFAQQGKTSYFRRSIRTAMKKWRFEPAQVNGKAVESRMSRIFSFSLAD